MVHRQDRPTVRATRRTTITPMVRRLEGPLRLVTRPTTTMRMVRPLGLPEELATRRTTTMPMVLRPDRLLLWAGSGNGGVWWSPTNSGTTCSVRFDGWHRMVA